MANPSKPTSRKPRATTVVYPAASDEASWIVSEPGVPYSHWSSVIRNVTGKSAGKNFSLLKLRGVVQEGIDREAFERIRRVTGVSNKMLSGITRVPMRTLARRRLFKPDETERLLRVASVFQKGMEVLEDVNKTRRWLTSPKRALGGLAPLDCCDTAAGALEVEDLLERIADGVFS